jgi:hypothetical protein
VVHGEFGRGNERLSAIHHLGDDDVSTLVQLSGINSNRIAVGTSPSKVERGTGLPSLSAPTGGGVGDEKVDVRDIADVYQEDGELVVIELRAMKCYRVRPLSRQAHEQL